MEPIYEYKEGEGWIAYVDRRVKVRLHDGTEVWFIDRKPVPGEHHINKYLRFNAEWGNHENANLVYFAENEIRYGLNNYTVRKSPTYNTDFTYIVVEPCQ